MVVNRLTRPQSLLLVLFVALSAAIVVPAGRASAVPKVFNVDDSSTLPTVWHIIWSDQVSPENVEELKAMGFDSLFKCVAYRPNYPNPPIYAGGEWWLVEATPGAYDWSDLRRCLDTALQANMWVIPDLVINIPPEWLLDQYPDAILRDSRGEIAPMNVDAPYLLSPWFVDTGSIDNHLISLIDSFLTLLAEYPNVAGFMLGNHLLSNLPWRLGDGADFTYWPIFDAYAVADYEAQFGSGPPETWGEYEAMSLSEQSEFRGWLIAAINSNLQTRYLPWVADYEGWKIFNAPIWNGNDIRPSIFTTMTPEMVMIKQAAMKAAGVDGIVINDDNMGDCGLATFHQQDIDLAIENGFLIVGERVPKAECTWEELFNMWQSFEPIPDAFINIREPDPYWIGQFRLLYGSPEPPPTSTPTVTPMVSATPTATLTPVPPTPTATPSPLNKRLWLPIVFDATSTRSRR